MTEEKYWNEPIPYLGKKKKEQIENTDSKKRLMQEDEFEHYLKKGHKLKLP